MRRFLILLIVLIAPQLMTFALAAQSAGARTGSASKPVQASKPAQTAAAKSAPAPALTPGDLKTDSLNYGDDVKRIYVGDFEHVRVAADGAEISILVGQYMSAFADRCDAYLPKNKVEITKQVCTQEAYRTNRYGEVPGSRYCVSYETVGTGKFADPEVYELNRHTDAAMAGNMVGDLMKGMKSGGGDLAGGMKKTTDVMVYAAADMDKLLAENGCANPSIMRFQANLLRYGWGKEPIRMPGGVGAVPAPVVATTGPFKDQNYKRLIDDLITEESRAWMMNQYQKGSVTNDQVKRDGQGRPSEVDANYGYIGMGRPYKGSVRVTFRNGAPECIYFSDFPTTCRAPNPRVISAYERQQYAN